MASFEHRLDASTDEATLLAKVAELNADPAVHGILVQLPLPAQIDSQTVIAAIDPDKDVAGFHVINPGRLMTCGPGATAPREPSPPLGYLLLLEGRLGALSGPTAVGVCRPKNFRKPKTHRLLT